MESQDKAMVIVLVAYFIMLAVVGIAQAVR